MSLFKNFFRYLISIIFIIYSIKYVDDFNLSLISYVDISFFLLSILFILTSILIATARWHLLVKKFFSNIMFTRSISNYFIGLLINQFVPSTLGGDIYRSINIIGGSNSQSKFLDNLSNFFKKTKINPNPVFRLSFLSVFIDRLFAIFVIFLFFFISLLFTDIPFFKNYNFLGYIFLFLFLIVLILIHFLMNNNYLYSKIKLFLSRYSFDDYLPFAKDMVNPSSFIFFLFLSILIHSLNLIGLFFSFRAFGISLEIDSIILLFSLTGIAMILPITIAGWGIREIIFVFVLGDIVTDNSFVLLSSLLYGLSNLICSVPGLFFVFRNK